MTMPNQADSMMEEFDRWVMRISKVLLALLLLALYLLAIAWWIQPPPERRVVVQFTPAEKRWIAQRHKYHGISGSILENGEHYFYRNGKRCKL
jgi:hypothetical protein